MRVVVYIDRPVGWFESLCRSFMSILGSTVRSYPAYQNPALKGLRKRYKE